MDYLYDIEDMVDISDWFNDEEDVQNTEIEEIEENCPICGHALKQEDGGWEYCDYCGLSTKI